MSNETNVKFFQNYIFYKAVNSAIVSTGIILQVNYCSIIYLQLLYCKLIVVSTDAYIMKLIKVSIYWCVYCKL